MGALLIAALRIPPASARNSPQPYAKDVEVGRRGLDCASFVSCLDVCSPALFLCRVVLARTVLRPQNDEPPCQRRLPGFLSLLKCLFFWFSKTILYILVLVYTTIWLRPTGPASYRGRPGVISSVEFSDAWRLIDSHNLPVLVDIIPRPEYTSLT